MIVLIIQYTVYHLYVVNVFVNPCFEYVAATLSPPVPEIIEWFIEDQAFLRSCDSAPRECGCGRICALADQNFTFSEAKCKIID